MTADKDPYVPINCEFHDLLESLTTTQKPAQIRFRDAQGVEKHRTVAIADLYAREAVSYTHLDVYKRQVFLGFVGRATCGGLEPVLCGCEMAGQDPPYIAWMTYRRCSDSLVRARF